MVFGNMGDTSATGVAFTRDAGTGEDLFNGEFLVNAQGEDVVAGIRTPQQVTPRARRWARWKVVERTKQYPSLEELMPERLPELLRAETTLENHFRDMQDLGVHDPGRRAVDAPDAQRQAHRRGDGPHRIGDAGEQGMIDETTALLLRRRRPLNELLHPGVRPAALAKARHVIARPRRRPARRQRAVVFFRRRGARLGEERRGDPVRQETSPEDHARHERAKGILTARGGMTSHAAVVARGMGKCCVAGAAPCTST